MRHHRGRRTIHQLEYCLGRFFSWLATHGIDDLRQLSVKHVREFVPSLHHCKRSTAAVHASALRGFLSYLHMKEVLASDLASAVELPPLYRMSQPPKVLDEDTVERILSAVDRSTALGKRDYAILLLAARCGMRPSDIRALCFEDINWRQRCISIVQSKTQRPLTLPLLSDVEQALIDYIRRGRPPCPARQILVRHIAPIRPFGSRNNLFSVMRRAVQAAGIELSGSLRGLHLLRHSLATQMLTGGVPFDVIAGVLGHASVETTRRYAQVDLLGLRSVAMSEAEVRG
jgi:site-specific recombinase XerD